MTLSSDLSITCEEGPGHVICQMPVGEPHYPLNEAARQT